MATTELRAVPAAAVAVATPTRPWAAVAAAAAVGSLAAIGATWWITASSALDMTMRTVGF